MTLPDAALLVLSVVTIARARRAPSLRPVALTLSALCALAGLAAYAEGRAGWERVSVALWGGAWPGVVAALLLGVRPSVRTSGATEVGALERRERCDESLVGLARPLRHVEGRDALRVGGGRRGAEQVGEGEWARGCTRKHARTLPRPTLAFAAFLAYGIALAAFGSRLRAVWPWPLQAPRLVLAALAAHVVLRREPLRAPQRVAVLLAAGMALGIAAHLWEPATDVWARGMAALSCAVWAACGVVVWRER